MKRASYEMEGKAAAQERLFAPMNRRNFVGLGALGALGVAAGLAGCSAPGGQKAADDAQGSGDGDASKVAQGESGPAAPSSGSASSTRPAYLTPPDPVADDAIAESVDADVVVIGAGTSGLVTALSALEHGLSVAVFSISEAPVARGGSNFAVNSKKMQELGIEPLQADPYLRGQVTDASFNIDTNKWYHWFNHSEEVMNWLIDTMSDTGAKLDIEQGNTGVEYTDPSYAPPGSHCWTDDEHPVVADGQPVVVNALAEKIVAAGGRIDYKVDAQQLVRGTDNKSGRVTAAIGKREDGSLVRYNAAKAVVMATGDFSTDREMMEAYCPQAVDLITNWNGEADPNVGKVYGGLYSGQGQKMGLWVGAAWQKAYPNAAMSIVPGTPSSQPYNVHGGLLVDATGKRFANEEMGFGYFSQLHSHLPGGVAFAIWDSEYAEHNQPWYAGKMAWGAEPLAPEAVVAGWDEAVEKGSMKRADTLADLVSQLGLPAETLDTIDEYNGFCDTGIDTQFYKTSRLLSGVKTPPFYGTQTMPNPIFLTVLGGLRTDINMRVCDADDQPIPGLYNVGTMVGDAFANCYNFLMEGHNYGMNCVTFGYLTGKFIAENE